jgi:hypothetical protein
MPENKKPQAEGRSAAVEQDKEDRQEDCPGEQEQK